MFREKDKIDALVAAASQDGWDISISQIDGAQIATHKTTKEFCGWLLAEQATGEKAMVILAHPHKHVAYFTKGKHVVESSIVNDGSTHEKALRTSYHTNAFYVLRLLDRMSTILYVFGELPEEFTPSDYAKTAALEYLPMSIVPRDMNLIQKLSAAKLSTQTISQLNTMDRMLIGIENKDALIEKTLEFVIRYGRVPMSQLETDNCAQVRLHRFGVDLPYDVLVATNNDGFYVKTEGIYKPQTLAPTIPFVLNFDVKTQMFYDVRCQDWPFVKRPGGIDMIVDRMMESVYVNDVALKFESLMGYSLSRMGFTAFASALKRTFGSLSLHSTFYNPTSGVFMMGSRSDARGLPTRLPMKYLEAYLIALPEFQADHEASKFQDETLKNMKDRTILRRHGR